MTTPRIAFVGLGAMGFAMARRLREAQYRVTGYDLKLEARARFEAAGGTTAATVAEACHGADLLIVMTVNADQAEDVLARQGGAAALASGATVIVMATCAPQRVRDLAAICADKGLAFVDAPVSGGVAGATSGTLTIMAAAPETVMQRAEPVLRTLGSNLFHLGEAPGVGAAMKIVNQLLCGVHIVAAAEGLAFAERQGIDPKLALQILSGSAASSWMLKDRGPRMVGDDTRVTSAVDIFVKDLGLVLDAGRTAKMGLPLAALAHQTFLASSGLGLGASDDSEAIAAYRTLAPAVKGS